MPLLILELAQAVEVIQLLFLMQMGIIKHKRNITADRVQVPIHRKNIIRGLLSWHSSTSFKKF
jgi:hypothetical protein